MIYFNIVRGLTLQAKLVQEGDTFIVELVTSNKKHISIQIAEDENPDTVSIINLFGDLTVDAENSAIATHEQKEPFIG